ncbi:uncharacterized protein LOC127252811 [Andrographis paniculata]|uniref:uncharacterized protein LOC127252811 n=1 Tax=Andrographis paniculata TaxID=175694 RepID=UPI0021E7EB9E|nr:uncharacterized protein LOC127252811 [Andrographis paniculata]
MPQPPLHTGSSLPSDAAAAPAPAHTGSPSSFLLPPISFLSPPFLLSAFFLLLLLLLLCACLPLPFRGESYLNVIQRLEPVIIELERQRGLVVVVSHQVFSAFGFVQKITTFEKIADFQVGLWCNFLIQRLPFLRRMLLMEEAFQGM